MKILFLDVDGVLNMWGTPSAMFSLNDKRMSRLERVIKETGASIVLSSTWRRSRDHIYILSRKLSYRNLSIMDMTTGEYMKIGQIRGDEIQDWLDKHPEVTTYAIVDDNADMLETQKPYLVQTDGSLGLMDHDVEKLISILGRKEG